MKFKISTVLPLIAVAGVAGLTLSAKADVVNFAFSGPGVSGQGTFTYTPVSGGADTITDISGTFSDSNTGLNGKPNISNASITGLYAINPVNPLPVGVSAPDFSQYFILNEVPPNPPDTTVASPALSYDNNFYPGGSPSVCDGYPASGGFLDVYGVLFTLDNGDVVGLWSNGIFGGAPADYGVAVADATYTYDYVVGGVTAAVPEPATFGIIGLACAGFGLARRRRAKSTMPA